MGLWRPKTMYKQFLNTSKTTVKRPEKDFFNPENGQSDPFWKSKFEPQIQLYRPFLNLWSWKFTKKLAFQVQNKCSNNSEITPEQIWKRLPKWSKITKSRGKFWQKILIFEVIYWTLELKIQTIAALPSSKLKKKSKPKTDNFAISHFISSSWNKRHTLKRDFWFLFKKKKIKKLAEYYEKTPWKKNGIIIGSQKIAKFPTYLVAGTVRDLVNHCKW